MNLQRSAELADALLHAADPDASFSSGHVTLLFRVNSPATVGNLELNGAIRAREPDTG